MPTAYVTAPRGTADELASALVEERLAACVNRIDCRSTYRWDGDVHAEDEAVLPGGPLVDEFVVVVDVGHLPGERQPELLDQSLDPALAEGPHTRGERATATVTNYGSLNLTWATPIPPPDQSVILGVGKPEIVPVWDPGTKAWGRGKACELTLTFDHRVADGADAASLPRDCSTTSARSRFPSCRT